VDIPLDIQAATVNENSLKGFIPNLYNITKDNRLRNIVSNIIDDLNKAERPVILAGNGIRLSGSIDKFKSLSEALKIPVLLTWKAIDFLEETNPLFVGRPGGVGQRGANFSQQNSDFFISIGARLDHGQTAYQNKYFAREAVKVIVDVDNNEIKKLDMDIKYPVNFGAEEFIDEFLRQKEKINTNVKDWLSQCKLWQRKYPVVLPKHWEGGDHVNNYAFIDALSDELPEDSLIVPGSSGGCSEVTMQAFRIKKGMRMFNSEGLGPMGFGIAAAIGGCVASGGKDTICIDGDGGFIMNIQELETVGRLNLPIKFFVLNNDGYVSIRNTQNSHFDGNLVASGRSSGLTLPSLKKNAAAYDMPYRTIKTNIGLGDSIREVLDMKGPVVCEVMLSPTHVTEPKTSVYKKKDGSFTARPMEDLAPFLDREEFNSNMLISNV
jgi:acetolactate synthase-1/2/3 large subunit